MNTAIAAQIAKKQVSCPPLSGSFAIGKPFWLVWSGLGGTGGG